MDSSIRENEGPELNPVLMQQVTPDRLAAR